MHFIREMLATAMACVVIVLALQYGSAFFGNGSEIIPMNGPILGGYLAIDSVPTDIFSIGFVLLTGVYIYIVVKRRWRERTKTGPRKVIEGGKPKDKSEADR